MEKLSARRETLGMESNQVQKQFGQRVQALRKGKGLTQEQLAEVIGKSVDTISNIERGFSSTRIKTAGDIAETLGVTLADLFAPISTSVEDGQREQAIKRLIEVVHNSSPQTLNAVMDAVEVVARVAGQSEDH